MTNLVDFLIPTTDRGSSPSIWGRCPWGEIELHPEVAVKFFDDFTDFPITPPTTEGNWGRYSAFTDTGGTMIADDTVGGGLTIGSDGDNEGASLRTLSAPFKLIRGGGRFWFEARVKSSTIGDTKHGFFLGLLGRTAITTNASTLSAITPLTAGGAIADTNIVGFHRLEGDGDKVDTIYKADGVTQVTLQADAVTLVADTYIKLGMMYEPSFDGEGTYRLSFYQNGTRLTTSYGIVAAAGTDFPNDVNMGLVLAVLNATGSTPGTVTIDWWRACQEFLT